MNEKIVKVIEGQFDQHRYIFWSDAKGDLRSEFKEFQSTHPDIVCLEVLRNELGIKYRVLRQEPKQKFLIYRAGVVSNEDNWLLDMELSSYVFSADKVEMWRTELGLDPSFRSLIEKHQDFFNQKKRREALPLRLDLSTVTQETFLRSMVAICAGADNDFGSVLNELLHELAEESNDALSLIQKCNLTDTLWNWFADETNYQTASPGIEDFAIEFFKTSCDGVGVDGKLNNNARILMSRWMDSSRYSSDFIKLSNDIASKINIENALFDADIRDLSKINCFVAMDRHIADRLITTVTARTINLSDVEEVISKRRNNIWCKQPDSKVAGLYDCVLAAARLFNECNQAQIVMSNLTDAVRKYAATWYRIDQCYRQFCHYNQRANLPGALEELTKAVESKYNDDYLYTVNVKFQKLIDDQADWRVPTIPSQREFFNTFVDAPYLSKNHKVVVIISDALRYEIGDELRSEIAKMDRFETELVPMVGSLPSYTQLGMAALLPNKTLEIVDNASVKVDGKMATGRDNRAKILSDRVPSSTCLLYQEIRNKSTEEIKTLIRDNSLIYIYHNCIDDIGEGSAYNGEACSAAAEAISQLKDLIKRLTSANVYNLIVTADHGFLYRATPLVDQELTEDKPDGNIMKIDRRFVIGTSLEDRATLRKFSAMDLGLIGDTEVQLPRGIMRLRQRGNEGRYVHGGSSLQEIVIPVLNVHKKRSTNVSQVEVSIYSSSDQISTNQISVILQQETAVTEKVQPRTIQAGLYTVDGTLISQLHEVVFDCESSNPQDLGKSLHFLISSTAKLSNGQDVYLVLKERIGSTTQYTEYKKKKYINRRTFAELDFDL